MLTNLPEAFVPSVPLQLEIPTKEGKRQLHFKLTFDFNALALAEQKLGVSMLTLNPKVWTDMKASTVAILLWASIQKENDDYEGEEGLHAIGSYLYGANVAPAITAVNEAYIVVQTEATQKFIREYGERAVKKAAGPASPNEQTAETTAVTPA